MSNSNVSEVSICNLALGWLGTNRIVSLDDPSVRAQLCKETYYAARDAVLEARMWTFATVRAKSTVADLDAWGTMYKHPFPPTWLSVFRVYRDVSSSGRHTPATGWATEGRNILARESTVYMWGIERIEDTGRFSPLFTQALATRLAADLAMVITENRQLQVDLYQLYEAKLAEAATRDGQQGAPEHIEANRLVGARAAGAGVEF